MALKIFSSVRQFDSFLRTARKLRVMYEIIDAVELSKRWSLPLSWVREYTRTRTKDTIPHLRLGHYVRFRWDSPELNQWLERHAVGTTSKHGLVQG